MARPILVGSTIQGAGRQPGQEGERELGIAFLSLCFLSVESVEHLPHALTPQLPYRSRLYPQTMNQRESILPTMFSVVNFVMLMIRKTTDNKSCQNMKSAALRIINEMANDPSVHHFAWPNDGSRVAHLLNEAAASFCWFRANQRKSVCSR